jgi:hypothetical protein
MLEVMKMSYQETITKVAEDPEQLEQVYHAAIQAGESDAFQQAIEERHRTTPDNLLYGAWYYRLQATAVQAKGVAIAWGWVVPLALLNGLLFWWLSDEQFMTEIVGTNPALTREFLPVIFLLAAPISAVFVLIYLTAAGRKPWGLSALIGIVLLAFGGYVLLTYPQTGIGPFQEQYLTLMIFHLPLLAWASVGVFLIFKYRDPTNRFAFLIKSLEVFIVGGLFAIAGGIFTGITIGLFAALAVDFPEVAQRLFIAGGGGVIAVVAVAIIYNPAESPAGQSFDEGLSKLAALLGRILLPLTFLVLVVYLLFIPFNFRAPFENRDVLIIYNGMLFAVVALLVGATPVSLTGISPGLARWLRLGIIAVAALALIVAVYALAAILYRTAIDRLTPNRLAFIGWNIVNISLLFLVLFFQVRNKDKDWRQALYRAFSGSTVTYAAWTLVVVLATPWLFGINQEAVENLPVSVQEIVFDHPQPILLKCISSPHIYLLEEGEKRWIDTIETFNERGYVWDDVHLVTCAGLRTIPDGVPIPANAGPPPQP